MLGTVYKKAHFCIRRPALELTTCVVCGGDLDFLKICQQKKSLIFMSSGHEENVSKNKSDAFKSLLFIFLQWVFDIYNKYIFVFHLELNII